MPSRWLPTSLQQNQANYAACDQAKSGHLAAVRHLETWSERGVLHATTLDEGLRALRFAQGALHVTVPSAS
jgi:hypothetical protein